MSKAAMAEPTMRWAGKKRAAPEPLPDMFSPHGILADEQIFHIFDCTHNGVLAAGDARLADAVDAFIRIDDNEEKVAVSSPNWITFDVGDFHLIPPCFISFHQPFTPI